MICKKLFFYYLMFFSLYAQEDLKYQVPPKEILDLIDVTMPPRVLVDDNKNYMIPRTEGLFLHKTRDISFTLVVDDFGIKYTKQADVDHLVAAVWEKYPFKVNWDAKQYIGIQ